MAGLNIPKRSELPRGTFLGDVNNARLDAQANLSDYAERASGVAGDMLFGEDTGDGMLKDLAYGLVPGGSLFQRATTGTRPGLLDFADFVPGGGTGLKFAMMPIAPAFSRDLLKGGKNRLGKTVKNLADTYEARNYVHRVHRTRKENARSIDKQGLLVGDRNKNYGKNTGDTDKYPASVWLGFDPTNVPVLQYYYTHGPDTRKQLTTYRVRIPREVYNNTPRVKFEGDRFGKPKIVGKGESSITRETARRTGNEALIDVFANDIPPEWLRRIPPDEFEKLAKQREHRESLVDLYYKFYGDMENGVTPHDLSRFERDVLDVKPSLSERTKPSLLGLPMESVSENLSEQLGLHSGVNGKYRPAPSKVFDELLDRDLIRITRPEKAMQSQTGNWKDLIETSEDASNYTGRGSISRGHLFDEQYGSMRFPSVGERTYRWDRYKAELESLGGSPASAHLKAMPDYTVDWGTGDIYPFGEDMLTPKQIAGAISRPILVQGKKSPIQTLNELIKNPSEMSFDTGYSLSRLLSESSNPSGILEYFDKQNIPRKDVAYQHLRFRTKPGSIARGSLEWAPKNEILKAQNLRKNNLIARATEPDRVLSQVRRGLKSVARQKYDYNDKTLFEIMNGGL